MRSVNTKFETNFEIENFRRNFKFTTDIFIQILFYSQFRNFFQICRIISIKPTLEPTIPGPGRRGISQNEDAGEYGCRGREKRLEEGRGHLRRKVCVCKYGIPLSDRDFFCGCSADRLGVLLDTDELRTLSDSR
jgi:hypothetical protein